MIVVTGATGHIGNVLVRLLRQQGIEVRAMVFPGDEFRPIEDSGAEVIEGDVCQPESLVKAFDGADCVFHLAGIVTIMPGMRKALERVNIEGVKNVAAACREAGVRRLVYTSSIHAISEPVQGMFIDESLPFDPKRVLGDYAWSKAVASLFLLEESKKPGLEIVICCPTGIFGPYDYQISNFGQLILDFDSGYLKSYVRGAYDFVDVRDVAAGLYSAYRKARSGSTYIFSGTRIQVSEVMEELSKCTGRPAPTYEIPFALARTAGVLASAYYRIVGRKPVFTAYSIDVLRSNSFASSDKARAELGFISRPWQDSVRDQYEWFKSHGMIAGRRN